LQNRDGNRYESLEKYDAAHTPLGLLRRYVNGRARAIWLRLGVAIFGCVFLGLVISPFLGLVVVSVTLTLEVLEFWILKRWVTDKPHLSRWTTYIVCLASGLQSIGIGFSIFVTGMQSTDLRMVAWSFLLGAVLNSMLAANYHPASNTTRLWVLSLSAVLVLLESIGQTSITRTQFLTEAVALGAMGLMLWHLSLHLSKRDKRMQRAERELIHRSVEAERLALVAEHASDSILLMDPNLSIEWVNPQFTKTTGYSADFAIGRPPATFLNHPDTSDAAIAKLIKATRNKESVRLRILNKTRDGRAIWMETHQTPVFDEDDELKAFIAVERDATDIVAREKQLRLALVAAEEADREKAAFLSRMSHELRTPANGIIGGVDILRETPVDASQVEALSILEVSAQRLCALVDNIVTMTGLEAGSIQAQFEDVRISSVFNAVVAQHRYIADEKAIEIKTEIDPSARAALHTDAEIIHGVLEKLVDNAVKFTNKGQVQIKARVTDDEWLHVSVIDSGVGIPSDEVSKIFEAFEQVDEADTRDFDGAGLGLATAKNLAALLGGRIRVSSVVGEGSHFKVKIPVKVVCESESVVLGSEGTPKVQDMKESSGDLTPIPVSLTNQITSDIGQDKSQDQMRLLVAEDNRANRLLIKTMLKSAGHAIDFAEDGEQAVQQYIENRPDFVLMDLSMPNKNGFDATREIRAFEKKDSLRRCPIVAVTANVTDDDRRKCLAAGMDAFLPKPVKKAKLLETIVEVSA
jgi:PAS domain S-box-containing protein